MGKDFVELVDTIAVDFATTQENVPELLMKIYSDNKDEEVFRVTPVVSRINNNHYKNRKKAQNRMRMEKKLFPAYAEEHPERFQKQHYGRCLNHARFDHFETRPYLKPYVRKTNTDWLANMAVEKNEEGEFVWA